MQHLHTEYERELVPLFVKVLLSRLMGSELEDDIIHYFKFFARELRSQIHKQRRFFFA